MDAPPTGHEVALLEGKVVARTSAGRDVFGRLTSPDTGALSRRWLATGLYLRSVTRSLTTPTPPSQLSSALPRHD